MKCPKCKTPSSEPVTKNGNKWYCPKCNYAWDKQSPDKKGTLKFDGVVQAEVLVNAFTKGQNVSPEIKTAMLAQITGGYLDQWFEGFKCGTLATLIHKRENDDNGKTRSEPRSSAGKHREGTQADSKEELGRKDSVGQQPGEGAVKGVRRIKERIADINVVRPQTITPTENQYARIAEVLHEVQSGQAATESVVKYAEFDGVHLTLKVKLNL